MKSLVASLVLISAMLPACKETQTDRETSDPGLDSRLRASIESLRLTGDPSLGRELPSLNSPLAQLGRKLFYTKALGGDKDSACVTCHHPVLGGGDQRSLPVGVGALQPDLLGPGRFHAAGSPGYDGGPTVPRNVLSTFNSALYDKGLFWDSRVESLGKTPGAGGGDGLGVRTPDTPLGIAASDRKNLLHAQAGMPVTSAEEMRGFSFEAGAGNDKLRNHLAARLGNYGVGAGELAQPRWTEEFRAVYGPDEPVEQLITFSRIAEAIAAFEATQIFVNTPWRDYVSGNDQAISTSAKRGALLFFLTVDEGGAGCAACHSGDFFTDEEFHATATPQAGRGKGDGPAGDDDYGRFRETGDSWDMYAFRTPNLLNLRASAPYGHAGTLVTLEAMVRYHLDPRQGLYEYDPSQLAPNVQARNLHANSYRALAQLEAVRAEGRMALPSVQLNAGEFDDLIAFLDTLNDPCTRDRQCLAPWIIDDGSGDPDGIRLIGYDTQGRYY